MEIEPPLLNNVGMSRKVISRLKERRPRHFIKEWRDHRQLTQERLAERIGKSTSTISQLETGKQGYTQSTLEALADALQCEPADLLMRDPSESEAIWTIWEQLKPAQKRQAVELIKVLTNVEVAA